MKIPIISRFFEKKAENRNISDAEKRFIALLNGITQNTNSGADVNRDTACKVSAVFACVNYKASTISSLPCLLYKRTDRGKNKANNMDLYHLLHYLPNPETTAAEFWEMYIWNLELTGYGFGYIKRDPNGFITELWNVPTNRVTIHRNQQTKEKYYYITDEFGNSMGPIYPENMMVTVGKRFQKSESPLDPIDTAREAMGLGLALETYAAKYFGNGASVSGIVEMDGVLNDEAFGRFKNDFRKNFQGIQQAFNVMFLEGGSKFQKISNNPEESQAIDARKFQVIEICRFFSVPPHKVMDIENGSNKANMEQQNIDAVQTCLNPLCVKIELTIYKDLLTVKERKKLFAKFQTNALLRGDMAARQAFYNSGVQNGYFSPNDVRELEDMNPYDGGEIYMVNGNMVPVAKINDLIDSQIQKGGEKGNVNTNKNPR